MESSSDQVSHSKCFRDWMNLQERDLSELLQCLHLHNNNNGGNGDGDDDNGHSAEELHELVSKNIRHFEEYVDQRANNAPQDVSPYFCPTWCTSLEGSMLWAGGCRPSMSIRLVYTLMGRDILLRLDNDNGNENENQTPQGDDGHVPLGRRNGGGVLGDLSADQIVSINSLHLRTIQKEDEISGQLASLQEEISDQPMAIIARELLAIGEASAEAGEALKGLDVSMMSILQQADLLRLNTLRDLVGMLTPIQAADFLASAKKLHLCFHQWGRERDEQHGRT